MTHPTSHRLLCPGPVNVDSRVARALTSFEPCHREDEFEEVLESLLGGLLEVAGLSPRTHAAIVITGSGSAANESVISSAVPAGGSVLVISNGEFGERLARTSSHYHPETVHLEFGWGESIDLVRVAAALRTRAFSLVTLVHHETSTGMLNPVRDVAALCHGAGTRLFVDAVSSFAADPLDLSAPGIAFVGTSAGKALSAYPGLSVVFGSHESFRRLETIPARTQYLDLGRHYRMAVEHRQTPNTPAVPLFLALDEAVRLVLEEGLVTRMARLASLQGFIRDRVSALGFELMLDDATPCSNVLTTCWLPTGIDYDRLRAAIRARGYIVYGGKGPLVNRVIQISALGTVDEEALEAFFEALADALDSVRGSGIEHDSASSRRQSLASAS
jgi:2-aminoethylphosphonate-pyruvate transaminase